MPAIKPAMTAPKISRGAPNPLTARKEKTAVRIEADNDGISQTDVAESIINAVAVYKKIRSQSPYDKKRREYLYIIISPNLDGVPIYTKGRLAKEFGNDVYYLLVSSKKAL